MVSGYASAEAARAACMGQSRTQLEEAHRPAFTSAVHGVMARWTALRLAVDNEWGGERSGELADELEASINGWFCSKGAYSAGLRPPHKSAIILGTIVSAGRQRNHAKQSRGTTTHSTTVQRNSDPNKIAGSRGA